MQKTVPTLKRQGQSFYFVSGLSQLSAEGAKQRTTRYAGARQRLYQKNHLSRIMELFKLPKYTKRKVIFTMANQYNSLSHTRWMCKYHIVFTPKYRRKIIYNQYRESIQEIIKTLCKYKGVEIIEGHMMPDHVHLLVSIPPKLSVSSFMGYLKGKSGKDGSLNKVKVVPLQGKSKPPV